MSEIAESIPLDLIDPLVNQSRERFDDAAIRQLAENIKSLGQLQPGVAVFDEGRQRYTLLSGECRLRALKLAGRPTMDVKVIRQPLSPGQMLEINVSENVHRSNLDAVSRGRAFQKLMRLENLTARQVAERMNLSDATVSRDLSLLGLSSVLQNRVMTGELPSSVAATIARVGDDETRREIADLYAGGELDRSDVEARVKDITKPGRPPAAKPLRLKLGGTSLTISGKQPLSVDGLLSILGRITKAATKLKESGAADISALGPSLKAS